MKRKLTNEERELTKKAIERNTKLIEELKEQMAYNNDILKFEDKWHNFLWRQKRNQYERIVQEFNQQIKIKQETIEANKKQLSEGIEAKEDKNG